LLSTISVGLDEKEFDPYLCGMLSPEQSRAARGWLDWSQQDLADRSNVSLSTVRDFEKGRRTPIANNLEAMARALEKAGMELTFGPDGTAAGIAKRV
jgi:transcriptional regulator with XRE-family HTH domain